MPIPRADHEDRRPPTPPRGKTSYGETSNHSSGETIRLLTDMYSCRRATQMRSGNKEIIRNDQLSNTGPPTRIRTPFQRTAQRTEFTRTGDTTFHKPYSSDVPRREVVLHLEKALDLFENGKIPIAI